MGSNRWIVGAGVAALAVGVAVAPAIGASEQRKSASSPAEMLRNDGGLGRFTPSAADPKLAALLARSGIDDQGFRFTPAESRRTGNRSITVAVRARSLTPATRPARDAVLDDGNAATIGLKPIAYNLGVAVGWKRFAVSGDVSRIDLGGAPGSRESADVGITYAGRRFTGRVVASAARPLADAPRLTDAPSYSVDVGGSYSLTRRLDVTAGVRYKSENYRLDRLTDNRRDSQAVYVGTALRF